MLFPHPKSMFPTYRLTHISSATCTHFSTYHIWPSGATHKHHSADPDFNKKVHEALEKTTKISPTDVFLEQKGFLRKFSVTEQHNQLCFPGSLPFALAHHPNTICPRHFSPLIFILKIHLAHFCRESASCLMQLSSDSIYTYIKMLIFSAIRG